MYRPSFTKVWLQNEQIMNLCGHLLKSKDKRVKFSSRSLAQIRADFLAQVDEGLLLLWGKAVGDALLHLAHAALDALVKLDGPGGELQFFQAGVLLH